jgi:OmcA/MtrC family decaheme c-type cytochrome
LTSATKKPYSIHEKAYYASQEAVNFVRPGLMVQIQSAEIAADGTVKARVKFTDPQGLPLDKDGITTPGKISNGNPSAIVAVFPKGKNHFEAYTTRSQTSSITGGTAIQAGADSGGTWQKVDEGEYVYTFKTRAPSGFDPTAVHAIGVYANRILTEFDMGTQLDDDVFYFTPSDGKQTTNPRDIIRTATCQKCHGPNMAFHGTGGRTSVQSCDLCHTPQTVDPDTGNTVDMTVMIHKVHMGSRLPSVAAGKPYEIIGHGGSVHDYSHVVFPQANMTCESCHEQNTGATMADAFLTRPNREACGACHDNVNFATGEGHVDLPQTSDNQCSNCHIAQGELDFDTSIKGAHVIPQQSRLLSGLAWEILKVEDGLAGKKPVVTFSVKDKNGNGIPMSAMERVTLTMAGPSTDYTGFPRGYIQDNALKAEGADGVYSWTFTTAIPEDARGTFAIGLEGRRTEKVLAGTKRERSIRYGAKNPVYYFSVDGSEVQPRREPTAIANCNGCHTRLSLHGENRVDNVAYCVMCHNPAETDASRRPADAGAAESIDMKFMTHRIHGGTQLHSSFGTDYTVYGYSGTPISFSHVGYPAPLTACYMCHVNGSENPGLNTATMASVNTPRHRLTSTPGVTAACYGCHDNTVMLSHAQANTTGLGESCAACHSQTSDFAPTRMHIREVSVSADQKNK